MNAGEGGLVVFPGIFGSPIDPSTPMEDRDVARLGTGLWNRVLFDCTRSWKFERRAEWGGERFPPTVRPASEDEARVRRAGRNTVWAICRSGRDFSHDMVLDFGAPP